MAGGKPTQDRLRRALLSTKQSALARFPRSFLRQA
jgi:hypothetical protein